MTEIEPTGPGRNRFIGSASADVSIIRQCQFVAFRIMQLCLGILPITLRYAQEAMTTFANGRSLIRRGKGVSFAQKLADWLVPAGLIALALVPLVNGWLRLAMLARGGPVTPEALRFSVAPVPIVLHIVTAMTFAVLGAIQFSPGFRRWRPGWHRIAGRLLVGVGFLTALTGFWMALTYDFVPADGPLTHALRLAFGPAMIATLVIGFLAIRRRNIATHQAWMRRTYAIGLVVGTQTTLLLPFQMLGQIEDPVRSLAMSTAWILNLGTAEWLIYRARQGRTVVPVAVSSP